jgi:DNA-binding transcriptional ArsR family regulator
MTMTAFELLAEPARRRILDLVRDEEHSVGELVEGLAMSQPAVSKHLRVLRQAGLVTSRVSGQRRLYRLEAKPLKEVEDWLAPYRRYWEESFTRLDAYLEELQQAERPGDPDTDDRNLK